MSSIDEARKTKETEADTAVFGHPSWKQPLQIQLRKARHCFFFCCFMVTAFIARFVIHFVCPAVGRALRFTWARTFVFRVQSRNRVNPISNFPQREARPSIPSLDYHLLVLQNPSAQELRHSITTSRRRWLRQSATLTSSQLLQSRGRFQYPISFPLLACEFCLYD